MESSLDSTLPVTNNLIKSGVPILAVASFGFRDLEKVSSLLHYKFESIRYKKILEKFTLYEVESINEKFLQGHDTIIVFINWNENHQINFTNEMNDLTKEKLPQRLMAFCKKKAKEAIPKTIEMYEKVRESITKFKNIYNDLVIEVNDLNNKEIADTISQRIFNLNKESTGEEKNKLNEDQLPGLANIDTEERKIAIEVQSIQNFSTVCENIEKIPICYLILPIGIPGMGKTFMMQAVKKFFQGKSIDFFSISSDEIRLECIKEYKKTHLGCDDELVFKKTAKSGQKKYYEALFHAIESNKSTLAIYCDKTHPPEALVSLQKKINKQFCGNTSLKLIGIAPKCSNPIEFENIYYEFSIDLLKLCLYRVVHRESHQTLNGPNIKRLKIVFEMLNLYKNYKIDSCLTTGIDYLLKIPFSHSDVGSGFSENCENVELDHLISIHLQRKYEKSSLNLEKIVEKLSNFKVEIELNNEVFIQEGLTPIFDLTPTKIEKIPDLASFSSVFSNIPISKLDSIDFVPEEHKKSLPLVKNKIKEKSKPFTYIGIDLERCLKDSILSHILNTLSEIKNFSGDLKIENDITEITKLSQNSKSRWKFPNSMHITSLFIGGQGSKLNQQEYTTFQENINVKVKLTHLLYSPACLICAKILVVDEGKILIENKIPHVTLVLCDNTAPKYSNTLLQKAFFDCQIQERRIKGEKSTQICYSCPINDIICDGITKGFY